MSVSEPERAACSREFMACGGVGPAWGRPIRPTRLVGNGTKRRPDNGSDGEDGSTRAKLHTTRVGWIGSENDRRTTRQRRMGCKGYSSRDVVRGGCCTGL